MKPSFSETILKKIHEEKLQPFSRRHFVLQSLLKMVGGAVLAVLGIFLGSAAFSAIENNNIGTIFTMGWSGVPVAFVSLPWAAIGVTVFLVICFFTLFRKTHLVYRRPLLFGIIFVFVFAASSSVLLARTSLHDTVSRFSEERNIPLMRPFYRTMQRPMLRGGAVAGVVQSQDEENWVIDDEKNAKIYTIQIDSSTKVLDPAPEPGDPVMVLGEVVENTVKAKVIRVLQKSRGSFARPQKPVRPNNQPRDSMKENLPPRRNR